MKDFPSLGVVILAAGASSRMGQAKLLLPWKGTTVLGQLIRQWHELGAGQTAVVHRIADTKVLTELERLKFPSLNRIENPQPERGMFSSILCAAKWPGWKARISSWAIVLGDQPHLRAETLRTLLEFHSTDADAISQPEFEGRARHPVILSRQGFEALKSTPAETLEIYLKLFPGRRVQYPIMDPTLALDMDTPEDYKRILAITGNSH
jgi:molybdenum cofactor cytidylyltransferase